MTDRPLSRGKQIAAQIKRDKEERAAALAKAWCGSIHQTWALHARCQLGRKWRIEGEGPFAVVCQTGKQAWLYALQSDAERCVDICGTPACVETHLVTAMTKKSPHRRGLGQ